MRSKTFWIVTALAAIAGCTLGESSLPSVMPSSLPAFVPVDREAAARGKLVYQRNCEACHGARGDGQGMSAPYLVPRPRNFVAALYKCRSTPSGSLPLPTDLRRTITHGAHATAMPGWGALGDGQLDDIVEYVRAFSPRWQAEKLERLVVIPPETADTPDSRTRGHAVFDHMQCASCHGPRGEGNGPAVPTLRDEAGNAIVPFDFTGSRPLRCGSEPHDLYRTFLSGLDGTPMPSYANQMTPDEGWDLVHYLKGLRR